MLSKEIFDYFFNQKFLFLEFCIIQKFTIVNNEYFKKFRFKLNKTEKLVFVFILS